MLRSHSKSLANHVVSPEKKKKGRSGKDLQKRNWGYNAMQSCVRVVMQCLIEVTIAQVCDYWLIWKYTNTGLRCERCVMFLDHDWLVTSEMASSSALMLKQLLWTYLVKTFRFHFSPSCPSPFTYSYRHCSHSMRQCLWMVWCPSVRPSACPIYRPLQQRAAGLLLWAQRARNIDRLLHSRRCRVTVLGKLFTPIVPLFKQQNW